MAPRKLLIAEGSEEIISALTEVLSGEYHIRACSDGEEALGLLRSFEPDVMLLDLMLPRIDGLTILQMAADEGELPAVLAVSRFVSEYVSTALGRLGVAYVMRKPCLLRGMVEVIRDLDRNGVRYKVQPETREKTPLQDVGVMVTNLLLSLGFKSSHDGYQYLREAILIMAKNPDQPLTKELYPKVAEKFQRGGGNVERSCRTAVEYAWKHGDMQIWRLYFTANENGEIPKPANGTFITRMVEALRAAELRRL